MSFETHTTTLRSFSDAILAASGSADQSGGSPDFSEWFVTKEELSLRPSAIHLHPSSISSVHLSGHKYHLFVYFEEGFHFETPVVHCIVSDDLPAYQGWSPRGTSGYQSRFNWDVIETPMEEFYYPTFEDNSGGFSLAYLISGSSLTESPARARLDSALHDSFEAELLESGMSHPAEEIIGQALQSEEGNSILAWLRTFSLDASQPSHSASVLRCLGRQLDIGTDVWRVELVRDALSMNDVEIRDAAVQAVESWGDAELIHVLESHSEPVVWLQQYIVDVIDDLRK